MIALQKVLEPAPELDIHPLPVTVLQTGLVVEPSDISFHDLSRDAVMIRVKIRNEGEHRSTPAFARLEAAPLGAFAPRSRLGTLPVPPLEPGESRDLEFEAVRPHPVPLGDFNRVPPRRVLTALNAAPGGLPPGFDTGLATRVRQLGKPGTPRVLHESAILTAPSLPSDLWELFGREQPRWAGNIHVFVGVREVERHFSRNLRIHAGHTNMAVFTVGGPGKRDAYAFDLVGVAPGWNAALYDMTHAATLVAGVSDRPVPERQWVESAAGSMMMVLALRPPVVCEDGNVHVHVTRRSCSKTAVVEFNLNPTAPGPGCYVP